MKYLSFVLLFALAFTTLSMNAQKGNKIIEVTAIRLTTEGAQPYQTKYKGPNFDVDSKGILRADKGYAIEYRPAEKRFIIHPQGMSFKDGNNFDIEPVPGGLMYCMCSSSGNDDCEIQLNINDGKVHYFCQGKCGCFQFVVCDDFNKILEYETLGGRWFNP